MMKRIYLYPLWFALCLMVFAGCEWEVEIDKLKTDPRLVLNSVVMAGQPVTASVSRTWFFTEDNPNVTFTDAEVHLYVNGKYRETMVWTEGDKRYNSQGLYQARYCPAPEDHIALMAQKKGFTAVSAEVVVPAPCPPFEVSERITDAHYEDRLLSLSFRDNPGVKEYYLCYCEIGYPLWDEEKKEFTETYFWSSMDAEYREEPLFAGQLTAFEKILGYDWLSGMFGRVFSDDQIDGKAYTIRLPFRQNALSVEHYYDDAGEWHWVDSPPRLCRVNLYTISESYYRYLKLLIEMEDSSLQRELIKSGLAEPVSFYCNVENGLGILGAGNGQSVTFELSVKE